MTPAKLLTILGNLMGQKAVLLPAMTVLARAVVHLLGFHPRNADVETVVDALFVVVAVVSGVLGNAVDRNASKIEDTKAAINTNAAQLDQLTPPGVVAAKVPPVESQPKDPTP